ncbi:conserved hypothetical protein [Hyella patelloides LEGE 07179]|uniref:Na+-translocating membrane potential-generating system MpsC domain-containing protein n=1 Tax=Hyella patelloides LEGE 07179 TaxID=945734 RepID=A0A563VW63_9CYAN|nr:DUF2294 domain-containing protein [Hyella patelloides]VEP15635.1 conserved hypothetical protein [Hyella patelloides LEGE 07179]
MATDLNSDSYPTAGQLERTIAQKVRTLYRNQFGHQPSRVDCHLLGNKLVISLEDVITPIEKLLVEAQSSSLVTQVRAFIDEAIKPKLQELVEEISQVRVTNCLYDTAIDSGCAGAIIILANPPQVRQAKSLAKKK